MVKGRLGIVFVCLLSLSSCGSFPYKWYGLDLKDYSEGHLRGPEEKDDLEIKVCKGNECVVMLTDEFERLVTDHESMRERLDQCERD